MLRCRGLRKSLQEMVLMCRIKLMDAVSLALRLPYIAKSSKGVVLMAELIIMKGFLGKKLHARSAG